MLRKIINVRGSASADIEDAAKAAEYDAWFRRQVHAGLDDANAGRLVPGEEVEAEFAARKAATRRRIASG